MSTIDEKLAQLDPVERSYWEAFQGLKSFPQHRRDELFAHFLEGRRQAQPGRSNRVNSATESTWNEPDTARQRSTNSSAPAVVNQLPPDSPLVSLATTRDWVVMIVKLGQLFGRVVSQERAQMIAQSMIQAEWTIGEVAAAYEVIATDPEIGKQIDYARTITPTVFALAREREQVMRRRLFDRPSAVQYCDKLGKSISQVWDTVFVEGDRTTRFRLKDSSCPSSNTKR